MFFSADVQQPLSEDELRILKIVLAEHLDKLGLNLDVAISGEVEITKKMVVESLHNIGQSSISKILNNKQGDPPLPPTHTHAQCLIPYI